jgi:catechol-2,3-dioxygenase
MSETASSKTYANDVACDRLSSAPVMSAPLLSAIELHCRRYTAMVTWYRNLLHADVGYRDAIQCWLRSPAGWTLVLMDTQFGDRPREVAGLEGVSLEYPTFDGLADAYRELSQRNIRPERALKNGRVTSVIYRDPDGNRVALRHVINSAMRAADVSSSLGEDFDFEAVFAAA